MHVKNLKSPTVQNKNFRGLSDVSKLARPLETFYNKNAVLPTLLIETGVTLLRTNEANKRGGKIEALERFIEQGLSALVWLFGVDILKNAGEMLLKKINKLPKNLENKELSQNMKQYKAANLLFATAFATYFIGFTLPKINNKLVKKIIKKDSKPQNKTSQNSLLNRDEFSFENFRKQTNPKNTDKKQVNFLGNKLIDFASLIENNATARLLITDLGVVGGRCHNAKNKYKKIEGIFRDVASIYFYLRAPKDFAKFSNWILNNPEIDPETLNNILENFKKNMKNNLVVLPVEDDKALKNTLKGFIEEDNSIFKNDKNLDSALDSFIEQIISFSKNNKNKPIDYSLICQTAKSNIGKNFASHVFGLFGAVLALGVLIPKVQYAITKKLTNKNEYPGLDEYK